MPAPRWQPYRDGNSAGPCDESYIERDVGQLAGSDSRGNHCQDADKPRTTETRIPQFRLSFAMSQKVRPLRRSPFLRMAELPALPGFITFRPIGSASCWERVCQYV